MKTYKQKHKLKRNAKIAFTLAYLQIAMFVISFILIIVGRINDWAVFPKDGFGLLGAIAIFSPLFSGMLFAMIGSHYIQVRENIKRDIQTYRQRVYFNKVINLMLVEQYDKALAIYNDCVKSTNLKGFLYPFILTSLYHQTDKEKSNVFLERIKKVQAENNPEDILFV